MNSVKTPEVCKTTEKRDLKPKVLFCNVTISNFDFLPYSLYSNKNLYAISRSQICIKAVLAKN